MTRKSCQNSMFLFTQQLIHPSLVQEILPILRIVVQIFQNLAKGCSARSWNLHIGILIDRILCENVRSLKEENKDLLFAVVQEEKNQLDSW